jgi:hypothetical protein
MKRFLQKIGLFLVFFTGLCIFHNIFIPGPIRGNDQQDIKLKHFKLDKNINTVFIGSSRIFRHVDPALFDSLVSSKGFATKSFNFGTTASFYPECFFIYKEIMANSKNVKNVFFELQPVCNIGMPNVFSSKTFYYLNSEYLDFVFSYLKSSNLSAVEKFSFGAKYVESYIYKLMVGKYVKLLNQNSSGDYVLGKKKNGFLPLNTSKKKLINDTMDLQKRKLISIKSFEGGNKGQFVNKFYVKFLLKMVKDAKSKGINIYFVVPPRLVNYNEITTLMGKRELHNRVIELANGNKYPEFYLMKYTYDIGHLNVAGTPIFTRKFAEEFVNAQK